jgi:hypothetical protein
MDVLTSRDMDNLSGFHPFIRKALRTGMIPESEEIARALGEEPTTIACLREQLERQRIEDYCRRQIQQEWRTGH